MKNQKIQLLKQIKPQLDLIKRHLNFIIIVVFALVCFWLFIHINQLSGATPTEIQVSNQLQTISSPKVDPVVLSRIQQLQSQNIQVQALFNQARNNPFSE